LRVLRIAAIAGHAEGQAKEFAKMILAPSDQTTSTQEKKTAPSLENHICKENSKFHLAKEWYSMEQM